MPTSQRPLIALNGCMELGDAGSDSLGSGDAKLTLRTRYADAVLKAGGLPVALPPVGGPSDVRDALARVDGLVLGGGDDFQVEGLGLGATHPSAVRTPQAKQDFDFELARAAIEVGIPTLGICYGMQLLGLAEGAQLLQHLPEDRPGAREHTGGVHHPVRVQAGAKLAGILGVDQLDVFSSHHQALAQVSAPWTVVATDDEGLVEAIERNDHPFALGVQWHPEKARDGAPDARLFRALVAAASLQAARGAPARLGATPAAAVSETRA